jgi:hypothetical protein
MRREYPPSVSPNMQTLLERRKDFYRVVVL